MQEDTKKVKVKLTGTDGNIFSILRKCTRAMKQAGQEKEANELADKVMKASSYDEALQMCMRYCEVY